MFINDFFLCAFVFNFIFLDTLVKEMMKSTNPKAG